jgi:hypothetical protein
MRLFAAYAATLALLCAASLEGQTSRKVHTQRDAAYESVVESYTKNLKSGTIRKVVESYFRSKDVRFQQTCCFGGRHTPDDLVKIGQEPAPSYCSRTNIYAAFEFSGEERHPSSKALDSDKLERVSLLRWPEDCL